MASGTIFAGNAIKTLKQNLSLNGIATVGSGSADPSTAGFAGPVGSIYLRTNGSFYVKTGALDTNWSLTVLSGSGSASFSDSSFEIVDNSDASKKLKFEVSGVSTATTRTLTVPDTSGTMVLGTYTSGQVTYWAVAGGGPLFTGASGANQAGFSSSNAYSFTFTATASGTISNAAVKLLRNSGAFTGDVRAALWSTSGGIPLAELEVSPTILSASTISSVTPTNYNFSFSATSLVSGTKYAIAVYGVSITGGNVFAYFSSGSGENSNFRNVYATPPWGFTTAIAGGDFTITSASASPLLASESALSPVRGGTGIVNNSANTLTFSGAFPLSLTLSASTSLTLPVSGTLATLAGSESLTNKSISASNASLSFMTIPSGAGSANGWMNLGFQSAAPATPASGNLRIYLDASSVYSWINANGFISRFDSTAITANRTYSYPDVSGTILLGSSTNTFSGSNTFTTTPTFSAGISVGPAPLVTIQAAGSGSAHTLTLPATPPATSGDSLTYTGGTYSLGWVHPGELTHIAGENVSVGDVLYIAPSGDGGRTQGRAYKADASNGLRTLVVGFALNTTTTGNSVRVQTTGFRNGLSISGTVGATAYLSSVAPGVVATSPSSIVLGVFSASNTVAIKIDTGGSAIFPDNLFTIYDFTNTASKAVFSASNILSTTRTFAFPDLDGTFALLQNTQSFTGQKIFTSATLTRFNNGIALGTANTSSILPAGSITTYSVTWPGTAPTSAGEVLTHAGSNLLAWSQPGEIFYTAGENLSSGDFVYMSRGNANGDTGRTTGSIYKADATNDNRIEVLGTVIATVTSGNIVRIQPVGEKTGFTGLVRGQPVYLSVTTPGSFQTTAPSNAGQWIVQVGIATQTTSIILNPAASATPIYIEDSSTATTTIANNTVSPTAVTGLVFNGAAYRGVNVDYTIYRSTSTTEVAESGTIRAVYKTTAGTWEMDVTAVGSTGTSLTINNSGQVLYTSTSLGGTGYIGTMNWNIGTIG